MNGDAGVDPVQSGFEFRKKFARSDTIFRFPSEILNGKPLCKVTEQRDLSDPDNCNHVGDSVLCDRTNLCRDVVSQKTFWLRRHSLHRMSHRQVDQLPAGSTSRRTSLDDVLSSAEKISCVLQDLTSYLMVTLNISEVQPFVPAEMRTFQTRVSRQWESTWDGLVAGGQ